MKIEEILRNYPNHIIELYKGSYIVADSYLDLANKKYKINKGEVEKIQDKWRF